MEDKKGLPLFERQALRLLSDGAPRAFVHLLFGSVHFSLHERALTNEFWTEDDRFRRFLRLSWRRPPFRRVLMLISVHFSFAGQGLANEFRTEARNPRGAA